MGSNDDDTHQAEVMAAQDPYTWEGLRGWRSYRMLRPGRGMFYDVKRRLPYYWSDFRDGLTYRVFAATIRIYFVNLLPALAFELDMSRRTGGYFGINEALFSSALAALVFSLFSAQPLTVVGITGLISLFNYTIYDIVALHDVSIYPQVIAWVSIWAAITHWIISFGNLCDYMRYVTDFSANTFAMYVGIIYCEKGVQELISIFSEANAQQGFLSVVIAICFMLTVYGLEYVGKTVLFKPWIRGLLADYAYPIGTIFWTGFSHIPGPLKNTHLLRLPITRSFYPTVNRGWLVDFWNLDAKWVFVSLPMGILLTLLFYYDHNVSSITAQAKQFPLKKPAGFHWDFFLLGCTSFIAGIVGVPLPNGLVPQAPVHTDACTEYRDKVEIIHTDDSDESEVHRKVTYAARVVEQRLSHFLMALLLVGTMTRPLLVALSTTPRALYAGVFFVVGLGSVLGNNLTAKAVYLLSEEQFCSPSDPRLTIPKRRILYFLFWQGITVAATVAISQTLGAIGFPVIITALIPFRWVVIPKLFTAHELSVLDALTADNPVVLASVGGKPRLPEQQEEETQEKNIAVHASGVSSGTVHGDESTQQEQTYKEEQGKEQRHRTRGVSPQRVGDVHR